MTRCRARECRVAEAYADGLEAHTAVEAVDVVPPADAPTGRVEFDVLCRPRAAGLPPAVAGHCARYSLIVRSVQPQGDRWQARLVLRN